MLVSVQRKKNRHFFLQYPDKLDPIKFSENRAYLWVHMHVLYFMLFWKIFIYPVAKKKTSFVFSCQVTFDSEFHARHTVSHSRTCQHGECSLSPGLEPTGFRLKDDQLHHPAAWRFSWQPQQNEDVSSPDCQTWHRESSCPGRRPCPGGWGCCPSSRSLSRTALLPPEDRPLWSAETQTNKERKRQWRPRRRTVTKWLQCIWRVTSVVYWISICMLCTLHFASGCKLPLSLKNTVVWGKYSLNVIHEKQHVFNLFTILFHFHITEFVSFLASNGYKPL